jgi:FixJ family two-component response regulator
MDAEPTVFVVDDDPALRESLRRLMESVGLPAETFPDAPTFLRSYDPTRPGCLLLDIRMPGMSGLELQDLLGKQGVRIPIIVISAHGDVEKVVRALRGGAVDFIEKPYEGSVLLARIRQALALDARLREEQRQRNKVNAGLARLTPREREVLDRLVLGRYPKQIAAELGLGRRTVDVHRAHILQKMGARSVIELVQMMECVSTDAPAAQPAPAAQNGGPVRHRGSPE